MIDPNRPREEQTAAYYEPTTEIAWGHRMRTGERVTGSRNMEGMVVTDEQYRLELEYNSNAWGRGPR